MTAVVIAAARRTPIGSLNGVLSTLSASELGSAAIRAALADAALAHEEVSETILGQVLSAGQGMNPARQAARMARFRTPHRPPWSTRFAGPACGPLPSPPSRS